MKKLSFLTVLALAGFTAVAQDNGTTGMGNTTRPLRTEMATQPRFGLRGGVNFANIEFDDDFQGATYSTNAKTSFQIGAFVNIPVGTTFRIQPELSYVGFGAKVNGPSIYAPSTTNNNYQYEFDAHYLALPVMFQLHTGSNGFFFEAGPQVSYLISSNEQSEGGQSTNIDVNLRERKLVKKTDFALAAGLGYVTRIGLGINARYVHGVSNIFDAEGNLDPQRANREISNRGIQLGLVYHFGAYK